MEKKRNKSVLYPVVLVIFFSCLFLTIIGSFFINIGIFCKTREIPIFGKMVKS